MLDQCSLAGAREIRIYPLFYLHQRKAAGRQAGVTPARGTGAFWFGDLGLAGERWFETWEPGLAVWAMG